MATPSWAWESTASSVWQVTQVTPWASWAVPWGQAESVAEAASAVWQVTQSDSIVQFTGWPAAASSLDASPTFCSAAAPDPVSAVGWLGEQPRSVAVRAATASGQADRREYETAMAPLHFTFHGILLSGTAGAARRGRPSSPSPQDGRLLTYRPKAGRFPRVSAEVPLTAGRGRWAAYSASQFSRPEERAAMRLHTWFSALLPPVMP